MAPEDTEAVSVLSREEWRNLIRGKHIKMTEHAQEHLSAMKRKIYNGTELIGIITGNVPNAVHVQRNGCYATYFRHKEGHYKIILEITMTEMIIVTVIDKAEIPRIHAHEKQTP